MRRTGTLAAVAAGIAVTLTGAGSASAAAERPSAWGTNNYGQLGDGTTANHFRPEPVSLVATSISAGREHGLAVSGGAAWAWGWNLYGQLGNGTTANRSTPAKVVGVCAGSTVVEVAAGHYSSLARCANGTAWGWGRNDTGQLGDNGANPKVTRPQRIPGIAGLIQLAGGRNHSVGLKGDGSVWAWGSNLAGQLGTGTFAPRVGPGRVTGLGNIVSIIAGRDHSLALNGSGGVYAWGANEYGEIGDGTTTNRSTPIRVLSGAKVVRTGSTIGAGAYHSLAVMANGTVRGWGRNTNGQLGDGTMTRRLTPVVTQGLSGVRALAGGRDHSLAATTSGAVFAWGKNAYGQLGDGTTTNRITPTRVVGVSGATDVSGGRSFSLAL